MPKWLSSFLITIGFLALVFLAVTPRNINVTVVTQNDNHSRHIWTHGAPVRDIDRNAVEPVGDGDEH